MQAVASPRTLAQTVLPSDTLLSRAALVVFGAAFVALAAQVRIGLPFTPVPLTAQTFAALVTGAALGSRLGASSLGLYWLAGMSGVPVFNNWTGGWAVASGPTGGYLIGFVIAAFVVGAFAERGWDRRPRIVFPLLLGNVIIYALGLPWLVRFVGGDNVLVEGLWPFIPGDLLKLGAAVLTLPVAWTFAARLRRS